MPNSSNFAMMEIFHNYPLKSLNTFGIDVDAQYFTEVASIEELTQAYEFIKSENIPFLILGGGSNILFMKDFKGLILKINLKGIDIVSEKENEVIVKAGAGENWDELVDFCINKSYGGLENLSLIPGCVGASPVQNIGAYGVEMKDFFVSLDFYDFSSQKIKMFKKADCQFDYRNSIFKNELKGNGVVTSVTFQLDKSPQLKLDYGSIREELNSMSVSQPTIKSVRDAVIRIRQSKLPDPAEIGNAGSFFKNPVVSSEKHHQLKTDFPNLVSFNQKDGSYKLAAGWLIDQNGWKGKRFGDAGVHKNQALVLVNYGKATGKEIFELSENIVESVQSKFGVLLEMEVNVFC